MVNITGGGTAKAEASASSSQTGGYIKTKKEPQDT